MHIQIHTRIDAIAAAEWDALVHDNNPFLRHAFLNALEQHNCVGEAFGWLPCHIALYEAGTLIAAMPLYEKYNSYGEFVFDHAWADTYKHNGLAYYPKLVSAIPYTPASGQRFLVQPNRAQELQTLLVQTAQQFAKHRHASGIHWLFADTTQQDWLEQHAFITRHDCQFHWYNHNYTNFDAFLGTFTAKKRKNVKQERRKVQEAGITLRTLDGHSATAQDWLQFGHFYQHTFERKWGIPTLNTAFFSAVAHALPDQVLLILADNAQGKCIAGALMYRSNTRLYGRHWGCTEFIDNLHFEACYYQGIEYCITHNLQVFEPGAQGEHKVARGFIPTRTRSTHWLADERFHSAMQRHSQYEQRAIADYMDDVKAHLPYSDLSPFNQFG